jgi:hypothetical protein
MNVFISHSSKETTIASEVKENFKISGITAWLDQSEIQHGALLRKELMNAIKASAAIILLWSRDAAKSRWVAAEIMTSFHLNRFIIVYTCDKTALPYFLQNSVYLKRLPDTDSLNQLQRAVQRAPKAANEVPSFMSSQSPELQEAIQLIVSGQKYVNKFLSERKPTEASEIQELIHTALMATLKEWPFDPTVLNLAGYHFKNLYSIKYWDALQAGRPPKDKLLEKAERFFFQALFINPFDYSALNGLGSILIYEREIEAAEFFVRRAINLAKHKNVDYTAAQQDLELILAFKKHRMQFKDQ